MAEFHLTKKAIEDLSKIWDYTYEVWSEAQADKYYGELLDDCQALADNPALGRNYEEIKKEIFGYISGKHILFYRIQKSGRIEIARILHSRMDLKNRIKS